MRLIDADELMEHVWRDKLDCSGLIAEMVNKAPTVKVISTNIPISIFERLNSQEPCEDKYLKEIEHLRKYISKLETQIVEQEPKTGQWIKSQDSYGNYHFTCPFCEHDIATKADVWEDNYCSNCVAKLKEVEDDKDN